MVVIIPLILGGMLAHSQLAIAWRGLSLTAKDPIGVLKMQAIQYLPFNVGYLCPDLLSLFISLQRK